MRRTDPEVADLAHIPRQLAAIRDRIDAARSGRPVRLIAVSKGQPIEAIRAAYDAGQRDFGENYVQEMTEKADALRGLDRRSTDGIDRRSTDSIDRRSTDSIDQRSTDGLDPWSTDSIDPRSTKGIDPRSTKGIDGLVVHAIGPLQRNKVKACLAVARVLHTIDRVELAIEIDKRVDQPIDALVQVNVGAEPQKSGVASADAEALVESVSKLSKIRLVGLMTIPPLEQDATQNRRWFVALREVRDRLVSRGFDGLRELSMGMSHDFEEAIAEGATMVRVGTAIFGARTPRG